MINIAKRFELMLKDVSNAKRFELTNNPFTALYHLYINRNLTNKEKLERKDAIRFILIFLALLVLIKGSAL